eukprot:m.262556 g.262556  ORF g.262556 m.262556 type:complete len:196 (+) comp19232_c0_seq2:1023-1610(+)
MDGQPLQAQPPQPQFAGHHHPANGGMPPQPQFVQMPPGAYPGGPMQPFQQGPGGMPQPQQHPLPHHQQAHPHPHPHPHPLPPGQQHQEQIFTPDGRVLLAAAPQFVPSPERGQQVFYPYPPPGVMPMQQQPVPVQMMPPYGQPMVDEMGQQFYAVPPEFQHQMMSPQRTSRAIPIISPVRNGDEQGYAEQPAAQS